MTASARDANVDGPMVELYLIRHAHAGNSVRWSGPDDLRPLTVKGRHQAERLGSLLAGAFVPPALLFCSPKVRALQTAEILAEATNSTVRIDERLGLGFSIEDLATIIDESGSDTHLILVGHDPDFSELATDLVGAPISVRKGTLIRIDLDARRIVPGAGLLRWLIPPDALGS